MAATSPTNAWAVGYGPGPRCCAGPLIEHWDGKAWKIQLSLRIAAGFTAVAATSPANAWAVGTHNGALIEHWNGKEWNAQPSARARLTLSGVAATSATNAWAVAEYFYAAFLTVLEHWNGRAWKIQKRNLPPHFAEHDSLDGIAATSPTNAWAVGSGPRGTLALHWNGTTWGP